VDEVGRIGQGTFTVTAKGETTDASLLGYEIEGLGSPTDLTKGRLPAVPGEAVASDMDAEDGFDVGEVVVVEPGGLQLSIVGLARDAQLNVGPTLFVAYDTYLDAVVARNPDAAEPPPNVLGVAPADEITPEQAAATINTQSEDLDALTKEDAADETPGVAQVQQSFRIIFALYGLVVPFVTGLFFLIVTVQKAAALTLLRAIGAPARRLVSSLLVQVTTIVGIGLLLGVMLYAPLTLGEVSGLALRFDTRAVIAWSVALLVLAVASSLLAARRVLAIDPATAATGGVVH
jgi:putative ABC transport system permease protein